MTLAEGLARFMSLQDRVDSVRGSRERALEEWLEGALEKSPEYALLSVENISPLCNLLPCPIRKFLLIHIRLERRGVWCRVFLGKYSQ